MQILLGFIGKTNLAGVQPLIDEYSMRLSRFCKFEMLVLPDVKNAGNLNREILMEKEGEMFLGSIKKDDFVVILDENGKQLSSIGLADKLQNWMINARGRIVFLIGGAYGFSNNIYKRKDFALSLSAMTFNHQMVRAVFCEQLYRAFTIQKQLPYHHE
ncbi:MAG: 23S rRNA (pseudouridine(1915)-N(3))-methyltransferase RlmH [Bacteroidia bacterium]|nr:23S rRNA (pseudouridine(1915)-N(3))-methyltransferase RlmH [Bacteroidia bacterium]MCO5253686.1 23S rRNA (pseudouridine(1915)-N(3))-methyltransferase RlmH [Bacteroidota bacterium]MCZ2129613.1 23S rRNA (pseudouridine(1915)-N(3))-methyltransferase RlmH [Bacteroidia bacterium]